MSKVHCYNNDDCIIGGIADIQPYKYSDIDYPIELFDLFCHGNESNLSQCQYNSGHSDETCSYHYNIHCGYTGTYIISDSNNCLYLLLNYNYIEAPTLVTEGCTDGNVTLFNGESELEGILHICVNSVWITVCYNQWNEENNIVVCQQTDAEYNGTNLSFIIK